MTKNIVFQALKIDWNLWRQLLATFGSSCLCLGAGFSFGFSAILLPQLEVEDGFPYDKAYNAWIASVMPLAMIVGCLCAGSIIDIFGRKRGHFLLALPCLTAWLTLAFATNNIMIFVGRILSGIFAGAVRPMSIVYLGEICNPEYRAGALLSQSLSLNLGILVSHLIGHYIYWRTCCFLFIAPIFISLFALLFVKESPLWMLSKGKINEGVEIFHWFRGKSDAADKELKAILENHSAKNDHLSFKELCDIIVSKSFLKPLLTVFILFISAQLCGINTLPFYAPMIIGKTFPNNKNTFTIVIVLDAIRVAGSALICFLGKILPRKPAHIFCAFGVSVILIALIVTLNINFEGSTWVSVVLILLYVGFASLIPSLAWTFVAELFPSTVRGLASGFSSGITFLLLFLSVQITPIILENFGESIMYLCFATFTLFSAVVLCFILPETNGKTLQDIEDSYK